MIKSIRFDCSFSRSAVESDTINRIGTLHVLLCFIFYHYIDRILQFAVFLSTIEKFCLNFEFRILNFK